eukprot:366410-Chlamydomonas_euryale.AAC.4
MQSGSRRSCQRRWCRPEISCRRCIALRVPTPCMHVHAQAGTLPLVGRQRILASVPQPRKCSVCSAALLLPARLRRRASVGASR